MDHLLTAGNIMYNETLLHQLPEVLNAVNVLVLYETSSQLFVRTLFQFFSLSTLWRAFVFAFLISNAKNLPLVYHVSLVFTRRRPKS